MDGSRTAGTARLKPEEITNLERAKKTLIDAHHGTGIVELATVVGGAKQRDQLAFGKELVAIFDDLVSSADQIHIVLLKESGNDVGAECEGYTSVIFAPASDVLVGIRPKQITEEATVRNLPKRIVSVSVSPSPAMF